MLNRFKKKKHLYLIHIFIGRGRRFHNDRERQRRIVDAHIILLQYEIIAIKW